eukprot:12160247-Alexandrium_andersonii.AAC.1
MRRRSGAPCALSSSIMSASPSGLRNTPPSGRRRRRPPRARPRPIRTLPPTSPSGLPPLTARAAGSTGCRSWRRRGALASASAS